MTNSTRPLCLGVDAPSRPRPRFVDLDRKTFAWPCPRRSVFSILLVYELHDITVQLAGELDPSGVAAFEACVDAACGDRPRRLVLELSALESIDAGGVDAFIRAARRTEESGVELVVDSPSATVSSLLARTCPAGAFFVR